jgi:hypothetical protein
MTNRITATKIVCHIDKYATRLNVNINEGFFSSLSFFSGTMVMYREFQPLRRLTDLRFIQKEYESEEV